MRMVMMSQGRYARNTGPEDSDAADAFRVRPAQPVIDAAPAMIHLVRIGGAR